MTMGSGSDLVIESTKGFDPGFKLFGKTIPMDCCVPNGIEIKKSEILSAKQEEDPVVEQSSSLESNKENGSEGNPEVEEEVRSTNEAENNEGKNGEKPALKKPDKLLPCPRCESMDTKFCYYNNYNVNQPRHFCKNCQRYWTAGGTLRNVPVGAGRRKNKHSAAASTASSTHYRQIRSASDVAALGIRSEESEGVMIPCSLPAPCVKVGTLGGSRVQVLPFEVLDSGAPKVVNGGCSASGSTVLNFGPQGGVNRGDCEQMEWQKQNRDEISCGSSVTGEREIQGNMNPAPVDGHNNPKWPNGSAVPGAAVPFFAGPWPFGWNFAAPTTWGAVPWPMVSGSHLGAWPTAPWITAPWAVPAASGCNNTLDNGSPTLGKRSQSEPEGKQPNGCLWVPKTLRIDDPGEAAKSSFWTTLGLGDKPDSITSGRVMFKAFQPKTEGTKDSSLKTEPAAEALRANPAAFSRSVSFQESN